MSDGPFSNSSAVFNDSVRYLCDFSKSMSDRHEFRALPLSEVYQLLLMLTGISCYLIRVTDVGPLGNGGGDRVYRSD